MQLTSTELFFILLRGVSVDHMCKRRMTFSRGRLERMQVVHSLHHPLLCCCSNTANPFVGGTCARTRSGEAAEMEFCGCASYTNMPGSKQCEALTANSLLEGCDQKEFELAFDAPASQEVMCASQRALPYQ